MSAADTGVVLQGGKGLQCWLLRSVPPQHGVPWGLQLPQLWVGGLGQMCPSKTLLWALLAKVSLGFPREVSTGAASTGLGIADGFAQCREEMLKFCFPQNGGRDSEQGCDIPGWRVSAPALVGSGTLRVHGRGLGWEKAKREMWGA